MKTGKNVLMKGLSLLIVLLMLMSLGGAALADEEPALQPENTAVSQDDSAEAENSSEPEAAAEAENPAEAEKPAEAGDPDVAADGSGEAQESGDAGQPEGTEASSDPGEGSTEPEGSAEPAEDISYVDANGAAKESKSCVLVTSDISRWENGWYAVTEDVTLIERIEVVGEVNLILCDDAALTAAKGIHVPADAALTIWCQEHATGALTAEGTEYAAGIGGTYVEDGDPGDCGKITVNGGKITAVAGEGAQAIGGGREGAKAGTLTAENSKVFAEEESTAPVSAADREIACRGKYARLERCGHSLDEDGVCLWCGRVVKPHHEDEDDGLYMTTIHVPDAAGVTAVRVTVNGSPDYNDTPLFIRVESEPIKVGDNRTLVQPLVVNCKGDQKKHHHRGQRGASPAGEPCRDSGYEQDL